MRWMRWVRPNQEGSLPVHALEVPEKFPPEVEKEFSGHTATVGVCVCVLVLARVG